MKLRITQAGMQSYTGLLADVWFADGVATTDMSEQQIAYVRSLFEVEEVSEEPAEKPEGEVVELGGKATAVVGDEQPEPEPVVESEGGEQ